MKDIVHIFFVEIKGRAANLRQSRILPSAARAGNENGAKKCVVVRKHELIS